MKALKPFFAILLVLTLIASCRKDTLVTETEIEPPIPQTNIETTLNGFVTGRSGEPLADASVKILNKTTQTNELGYFEITGLVNQQFAVIEIEKAGYFNQYETIKPSRTSINRTRIQLTEKLLSSSVNAATGGTVFINQGSSVEFQPNSFVDESGNIYSGLVSVYSFYIDPTDANVDQIMPGNLVGINTNEELNILQSFGMVNVELEGQDGQKLNINKAATLKVDVPSSIENNAPAEIPLWYFDEESGLWREEGSGSFENGKYIGEVNHFTIWNFDYASSVTFITGQIYENEGISISRVRITDLSTGASITDWTDSNGIFEGGVPQNADLLLEVLSFCGENIIFSENIGPFTTDEVDLGAYYLTDNSNFSLVSGTMVDCDQAPIANASVFFYLPNQSLSLQTTTNALGAFSRLIPTCDGEPIEVRGLNSETGFVTQPLIAEPNPTVDLGDIEICTNISGEFGSVVMEVDGEQKIFDNCTVAISENADGVSYLFQYSELLAPDQTIYYTWVLTDSNNDLNNPNWSDIGPLYSPPSNAENIYYNTYTPSYETGVTNILIQQEASTTGELMILDFSNINIGKRLNDPNGPNTYTNFPGCSLSVSAVLQ